MEEDNKYGSYVLYKDYEQLQNQLADTQLENHKLKADLFEVETLKKQVAELEEKLNIAKEFMIFEYMEEYEYQCSKLTTEGGDSEHK